LADFRKILKYQILMKIRPMGTELFLADGQTHDEASSRFFAILRTRLDTGDKTTGYRNLRVNDMLRVAAGGNKLPPFVILNRKTLTKEHFCEDVIVCALKMRG
jgi:hypothetical protein